MSALYPEIEPLVQASSCRTVRVEAPLVTAWELACAWPESELRILPHTAHSTANPDISAAIVAATDRIRDLPQK